MAEAHVGLRCYHHAIASLKKAMDQWCENKLEIPDWELESSARQLAALAELHERTTPPSTA